MSSRYDLTIYQGATFDASITWTAADGTIKDLTGHTARMQIRPSYTSTTITENLTSGTGEISLDIETGTISMELSATRTAAIKVQLGSGKPPKTTYVYDLEVEDTSGRVTKLIWGDVVVIGEVTR